MKSSSTWKLNAVLRLLVVAGNNPAIIGCRCESSEPSQVQYWISQKCTPFMCTMVKHPLCHGLARWGGLPSSSTSSQSSSSSLPLSLWLYPPTGHGFPPWPKCMTRPIYKINNDVNNWKKWLTKQTEKSSKNVPVHLWMRWNGFSSCASRQQLLQKTGQWAHSMHRNMPSLPHWIQILDSGGASMLKRTDKYLALWGNHSNR